MVEPSTYQCRSWERRAATILRKAEDLLGDTIQALNVEHELTDHADNVVSYATDLVDILNRYPDVLKARALQKDPDHA